MLEGYDEKSQRLENREYYFTNKETNLFHSPEKNENKKISLIPKNTILVRYINNSQTTQNDDYLFISVFAMKKTSHEEHCQTGFVQKSDAKKLHFGRFSKVKNCPIYESIPNCYQSKITETMTAEVSPLTSKPSFSSSSYSSSSPSSSSSSSTSCSTSSSSDVSKNIEKIVRYLKKGEKIAPIESIDNDEWYFIITEDYKVMGYVQSYMTGKVSQVENLQYKYKAEDGASGSKLNTKIGPTISSFNPETNIYQFSFYSIGILQSCFPDKNGTPRQGNLVPSSRARLVLTIPSAEHALDHLEEFSHVWLIFVFHKNTQVSNAENHPKIRPPRLNGQKVGIFSTRTPHRPNPIGLSVAKIEKIVKNVVHLSGVDLVDGTPILDIKPYIPHYDRLGKSLSQEMHNSNSDAKNNHSKSFVSVQGKNINDNSLDNEHDDDDDNNNNNNGDKDSDHNDGTAYRSNSLEEIVKIPEWVGEAPKPRICREKITFTENAEKSLQNLCPKLDFFKNDFQRAKMAIMEVIQTDPRPTYVRKTKKEKLYGFRIDNINIRCSIDDDDNVKVVFIEPWEE